MQTFQQFLLIAPILLFSVIAHEIAHGWAALRQGDRTALDAGRLTWNPRPHIDPFFTILLPIMTIAGSVAAGSYCADKAPSGGAGAGSSGSEMDMTCGS